jgi:hypothetical protein
MLPFKLFQITFVLVLILVSDRSPTRRIGEVVGTALFASGAATGENSFVIFQIPFAYF